VKNGIKGFDMQAALRKYVLLIMMFALTLCMLMVNKNFATVGNAVNILRNISVQGVMACGMTLVLISGEIDLSFGSTAGLSGLIVAMTCDFLSKRNVMSVEWAGIIGMLFAFVVAAGIGALNAYWITAWKMPTMVATLAMQFVIYGVAGSLSKGWPFYTLPSWFQVFGTKKVGDVPICVFIFLGIFALFFVVLNQMKLGRMIYAVGGNAEAARLSGINVRKIKYIVMISNHLCAAFAGMIITSQIMSASATMGRGLELTVIASVVIGGIGVGGGKGNIAGTLMGLLFLGLIMNAMTLANMSEYPQYIVRGALILFAIMLNVLQGRPRRRKVKAQEGGGNTAGE
jgi:ribose/xylose/arabinose/galactoside ABC-type transport system permease subunit